MWTCLGRKEGLEKVVGGSFAVVPNLNQAGVGVAEDGEQEAGAEQGITA